MNRRNFQLETDASKPFANRHAGQVKEIASTANPIVKDIKGLALKKNRDAQNLFMAEGLKLVTDAIVNGWNVRTLIYAKHMANQPHLQEVAKKAATGGAQILEVSDKVLAAISRRDNPQMVMGVFEQRWHLPQAMAKMADAPGDILIALERVRDPGNLGTIIRTADASGAKGIILVDDTTDPYSMEAVRATMGSIFNTKLCRMTSNDLVAWRAGFAGDIIGTHLKATIDYRSINYSQKPNLLLMGNEQQGLSENLAKLCDHLAFIPMAGKADSLNLAISTAVMLFEMRRNFLNMPEGRN